METENETVYITEKNIYRMRIKNLESTFGAYNFWLAEDTEKQQTLLESYMIQLSNDACSFSLTLSDQKLLANLFVRIVSIPRSFDNFESTKMLVTFDRIRST